MYDDETNLENAILLVDSNRGIYAPQSALLCLDPEKVTFKGANHIDILTVKRGPDPDNSDYWESWDCLMDCVLIVKDTGEEYSFYQDGDIWLVPIDDLEKDN